MCPQCHGDNEFGFRLPFLLGGGNDTVVDAFACNDCGYEWIDTDIGEDANYFEGLGFYYIFKSPDDPQVLLYEAIQVRMKGDNANFELVDDILKELGMSQQKFNEAYEQHIQGMVDDFLESENTATNATE